MSPTAGFSETRVYVYQAMWHRTSEELISTSSSFLFHEILLSVTVDKL
jgi:hypothetical protein